MKIIVSQIGAREHYAVARALHQQGRLAGLVTDWYAFKSNAETLKTEKLKAENKKSATPHPGPLPIAAQRGEGETAGKSQKTESLKGERGDEKGENRKQKVENQNIFQFSAFKLSAFKNVRSPTAGFLSAFQHFSISAFQHFWKRGNAARAARCEAIPDELVCAFPLRSLFWKWRVRRLKAQGRLYEAYAQTDAAFATAVANLKLPAHDVFFGYAYASLETLAAEKARGVLTVLDQIDPGAVEFRLVAEEMARHPELAGAPAPFPTAYYERNRREWELADLIIVNSEWSRDALISEGVSPAKIEILPLAYAVNTETLKTEVSGQKTEIRRADTPHPGPLPIAPQRGEGDDFQLSTFNLQPSNAPLRVLWLGQVNVRKGIHYLMEAARLLNQNQNPVAADVAADVSRLQLPQPQSPVAASVAADINRLQPPPPQSSVAADINRLQSTSPPPPIHFDLIGPIGISEAALQSAPANLRFHGPVSRDRAAEWYQQSDVFVLPTLSDGFALTQLEALAHGLPVIATPNCGRVVEDGKTGFIVPARDAQALAAAIQKFATDRNLATTMSPACREAVKAYSVAAYGKRLVEIIEKHKVKR